VAGQVLLGVGVLAAGVYAVRAVMVPRLTDWYSSWAERRAAQRTAQQAQAEALSEAAIALKACQVRWHSVVSARAKC
jgi:hypothetical protein